MFWYPQFGKKDEKQSEKQYPSSKDYGIRISLDELIKLRFQAARIDLSGKKNVFTLLSGNYQSGFRGRGVDFSETRHYQPGDDIRAMDWRVTARTGHPHTKVFSEERERPVYILVDQSPSMFFGTKVAFKSVIAARAAALLAWAGAANGDRVGGIIYSPQNTINVKPASGKRGVLRLLKALSEGLPANKINEKEKGLSHPLYLLSRIARPGSMVCLLSDFQNMDEETKMYLSRLARHCDVLSLYIYDVLEKTLPPPGNYTITNGEQNFSFDSGNKRLRNDYERLFQRRFEYLEGLFMRRGLKLMPMATHDLIAEALRSGLNRSKPGSTRHFLGN